MMKKILIPIIGLIALFLISNFFFSDFLKQKVVSIDMTQINQNINSVVNDGQKIKISDEELKEKIGQMIMVGFRGTEIKKNSEIVKVIKEVKIGGIALSDYDVPSKSIPRNIISPSQTKKLISDLQSYTNSPLLIAVDAEGGGINRLKQQYGFSKIASPQEMGKDKSLELVKKESLKLAGELKDAGFNMNLAPVVDVNVNPKNPIIGLIGRSFSADKNIVFNNARIFIRSNLDKNVISVLKHFPGQGSAKIDTHLGLTDITNTYKSEELEPYKKLNGEGLSDVIMVGHLINQNIDKDNPATLSPNFLQDVLRKEIGFKGVIITDDMQMSAISKNYKFEDSIVLAVNAGNDIIYFFNNSPEGYDGTIAYKIRDAIFNAVKDGKIKEERILESYDRLIALKKKFAIIKSTSSEIKQRDFELLSTSEKINFESALNNAKYVGTFAEIRPEFLLGIFQEELALEKFDMCYLENFTTGEGTRAVNKEKLARVMNPTRDVSGFLKITRDLGKDPKKTLITCPMSFGWGGAMGPADFIPSTWIKYKSKVEKITGKSADPWNIKDAFLAAGLYLSESGASLKTLEGERKAAMIYFSGSPNSPYTWYAEGALNIAEKLRADIEIINKNQ